MLSLYIESFMVNGLIILAITYLITRILISIQEQKEMIKHAVIPIMFGMLAFVAMLMPFEMQGMYFDLRSIPIFFVGFVYGIRSGILAAIFPISFRFYLGGPTVLAGILAGLVIPLIIGAIFGTIFKQNSDKIINIKQVMLAFLIQFIIVLFNSLFMLPLPPLESALILGSIHSLGALSILIMSNMLNDEITKKHLSTQLVEAQNQIQMTDKNYTLLTKYSTDLITRHTIEGTYLYCSPVVKDLLGFKPEDLIGQSVYTYYHPEDLKEVAATHSAVAVSSKAHTVSYRIRKKDGSYTWFETTSKTVPNPNGKKEIVCVSRDVSDRKKVEFELIEANKQLAKLSNFDALTGIKNRRSFDKDVTNLFHQAVDNKESLSILLIDVDCFKLFNDTYGHQEGDCCLSKIAETISTTLKRKTDEVYRYGGEEFAVLLYGSTDQDARNIAELIRSNVYNEQIPHKSSIVAPFVTVSIGITSHLPSLDEDTVQSMIEEADQALYESKKTRNLLTLYKDMKS